MTEVLMFIYNVHTLSSVFLFKSECECFCFFLVFCNGSLVLTEWNTCVIQ